MISSNTNNWYSAEQINSLLEKYVGGPDRPEIKIFAAAHTIAQLTEYLALLLRSEEIHNILPLNVNALTGELGQNVNHWVAIYSIRNGNKFDIRYIDPMGRSINEQLLQLLKTELLTEIIDQPLLGDQFLQYAEQISNIELQGNLSDCGPILVYALSCQIRALNIIKINGEVESKSLGSFLREQFDKDANFSSIYSKIYDLPTTEIKITNNDYEVHMENSRKRFKVDSNEEQGSITPNPTRNNTSIPNEDLQKLYLIALTSTVSQGFKMLFNPSTNQELREPELTDIITPDSLIAAQTIITARQNPESLLSRTADYIDPNLLDMHPALKTNDAKQIQETVIAAAMLQRSKYFENNKVETPKQPWEVFQSFLNEFTQENGALDQWHSILQNKIKDSGDLDQETGLEMLELFYNGIKYIGSDAVNDPLQDPLNEGINPEYIKKLLELEKWLFTNKEHPDYDQYQRQYAWLNAFCLSKRQENLEQKTNYMFSLLKQADPQFANLTKPGDIIEHVTNESKKHEREEFQKYLLQENKTNIFESNLLRAFWEYVYKNQYGAICYQMVCESLQEQYKDSTSHQIIKEIWTISQLDTIHNSSLDARSRMADKSIDGMKAPNFGYKMQSSSSYSQWLHNPIARISGNIIIDAFHHTIDFAKELNVDKFLEAFQSSLRSDYNEEVFHNEYYNFAILLELFILEKKLSVPFKSDGKKTITNELKQAAKEQEKDLNELAKSSLEELQRFADKMLKLRPEVNQKGSPYGLVFGIGFNGELFDSPYHSYQNTNEIWINFSQSGRTPESKLFLEFIREFSRVHNSKHSLLDSQFVNNTTFTKYKPLIMKHISTEIKNNYYVPDNNWNQQMLDHVNYMRAKYENFISQLELDISFDQLHPKLQKWIKHTSNWYVVPCNVNIANDISNEEIAAQHFARDLLFDALALKNFCTKHENLAPLLYSHWNDEVSTELGKIGIVKTSDQQNLSKWNELTKEQQKQIIEILNKLVSNVHDSIKLAWKKSIEQIFENFKSEMPGYKKVNQMQQEINSIEKNITALEKQKKKNVNAKDKITAQLLEQEIHQITSNTIKQSLLDELPKNPDELDDATYKAFRAKYFSMTNTGKSKGSEPEDDISQCIEPLFAKVLGHDRFFSVFISQKINSTNLTDPITHDWLKLGSKTTQDVIAPCDSRCQYHVLGHVYTGDMLAQQSADILDHMRKTHGISGVPDLFYNSSSNVLTLMMEQLSLLGNSSSFTEDSDSST